MPRMIYREAKEEQLGSFRQTLHLLEVEQASLCQIEPAELVVFVVKVEPTSLLNRVRFGGACGSILG